MSRSEHFRSNVIVTDNCGDASVAWVTFPTAVYLVASGMSDGPSRDTSSKHLSVLLSFFSALERRFHSVLFMKHMLSQANDLVAGKKRDLEDQGRDSSPIPEDYSAYQSRSPDSDEAEVLEVVAKLLDMSLANDGKPSPPAESGLSQFTQAQRPSSLTGSFEPHSYPAPACLESGEVLSSKRRKC